MEMKSTFAELAAQHQDSFFISVNIDDDETEEIKTKFIISKAFHYLFS